MTIERINTGLTPDEKIRQLGEQILEVNGKIEQAKFNKNELDNLYTQLAQSGFALDRKYLRDVALGNTLGTYTNWSHLKAESGYSIWKIAVSNYAHNSLNNIYLDNIKLENRGEASAESATTFDTVKLYDDSASSYVNNTTEASTELGTEFSLMAEFPDYLYVGSASQFFGIKFEFQTRGSGYTLQFEYWNGSAWTELTANDHNLTDDTSNFLSDGNVTFDDPGDWATTTVDSQSKYWIRISHNDSTEPVTVAKAYYIIPANSVVGLLALNSNDTIAGNWAWCYYSGYVYVTIRNSGSTTSEGNFYITSSSSTTNKQNFFVYNHSYTCDYEDSSYSGV